MTDVDVVDAPSSGARIAIKDLDPTLLDLGLLVGFFVHASVDEVTVDVGLFADPFAKSYFGGIPGRAGVFADLLSQVLHKPQPDGPDGSLPAGSEWFPIMRAAAAVPPGVADESASETPAGDPQPEPSGVYVVLPKNHNVEEASFGIGIWHELTPVEGVKVTLFVYIPVVHVGPDVVTFALADKGQAIVAGATVEGPSGHFKGHELSLGGIEFTANIYLDGQVPMFNVSLIDTTPPLDTTIETLAGLLAHGGTAVEYLNAVISSGPLTEVLGITIAGEGDGAITLGAVLKTLGLLIPVEDDADAGPVAYKLVDLQQEFGGKAPITIVEGMLFRSLDLLVKTLADKPIVPITIKGSTGGLYLVSENCTNGSELFGVRLVVADLAITEAPSPAIVLQLGKFLSGEESGDDSWLARAGGPKLPLGISVFVLSVKDLEDPEPLLTIRVEAVSIGVDVDGAGGKPLVDLKGYTLSGIEARAFLGVGAGQGIEFGAATKVDGLGVPLGPGFDTNSGDNPVASSLIASGDGEGGTAAEGKKDAVNPAFSLSGAYVTDGSFVVQLYDAGDTATDQIWIPIQRAYGPLQVEKIGLGWDSPIFSLGFDGGVSLAALHVELTELTLELPIEHPADFGAYQLDLQGLGISFDAPPVEITGSFVKVKTDELVGYEGAASLVVGPFGLSALGEYAHVKLQSPPPPPAPDSYTTMFIFAVVDAPIGGIPPYFFVTAAAGGFGYDSELVLPAIDAVTTFPLIAGLDDPGTFFGSAGPKEGLAKLGDAIKPRQGEYWLAAGVRFTSFELVQSDALFIVEFGQELEIAVLGLSKLKLPPEGDALVSIELGLEVVIKPDEGFFGASAILTDGSYLLAEACHLTGGFAFFLWFGDNEHAGQFVVTIGGYYSGFVPPIRPSFYPDIPLLGFNWIVGDTVIIKGGGYFALTPTQVMVGGGLDLLFHAGPIKAWFIAQLDVVIGWAPFHFLAHIDVDLGVSLHIKFLFINITITLELGCDVTVWGPPTGGTVTVHLFIISFTIGFGALESAGKPTIDWTAFQATLLPKASPAGDVGGTSGVEEPTQNVVKITANAGVTAQVRKDGATIWIVRPDHFVFSTHSAIPASSIVATGTGTNTTYEGPEVSFRPMGLNKVTSIHTVTLEGEIDGVKSTQNLADDWTHQASAHDLPEATWGSGLTPSKVCKPNSIPGMTIGLTAVAPALPKPISTGAIDLLKSFTYFAVAREPLPVDAGASPPTGAAPVVNPDALDLIKDTLATTAVDNRQALYDALLVLDIDPGTNGLLSKLAANPTGALEALPWIGAPIVGEATL